MNIGQMLKNPIWPAGIDDLICLNWGIYQLAYNYFFSLLFLKISFVSVALRSVYFSPGSKWAALFHETIQIQGKKNQDFF